MKLQSSPGEKKPKRSIATVLGLNGGILCSLAILAAPADGCAPAADWCAVKPIVAADQAGTVCGACHGTAAYGTSIPNFGTYANTQAATPNGQKLWERMRDRVAAGTMPPGGAIDPAKKATLQAWFTAGAPGPAAGSSCGP
jgi:cytochrome c553